MVIDSHHHVWKYDPSQYSWISGEMGVLRRDFLPSDWHEIAKLSGVDGAILVQARQTVDETRWLLELSRQSKFVIGVVGWVPLISPGVIKDLEEFASNPDLKAVRHVLQDEPDDNYCFRDDFNRGIAALKQFNLRYDILVVERQLQQAIQLVDRHPQQVFVLDHLAKPRIREKILAPWQENIRELARRDNVYCKLSGLVTEADWQSWTPAQLQPYFDIAVEAFSPSRLMFGSDWPVCLVASEYGRWVRCVRDMAAALSPTEQERLFGETAVEAYDLETA
jgi:L-fuconolactonase